LYLPGLGTGPRSIKGRALANQLALHGVALRCLDLRVPSFRWMRLAAMLEAVQSALADATDPVVLLGTSFGGYVAAQVAARDRRVAALVLYAPALHLASLRHWHPRVTALWDRIGWLPVPDKTERRWRRVDAGLLQELDRLPPQMPEPQIPTLLIQGTRDRMVPPALARELASRRANIRLLELADGHALSSSLPRVLAETERFLAPLLAQK
jgi:pimeloyl-ACP methyl ester carboxylesterase